MDSDVDDDAGKSPEKEKDRYNSQVQDLELICENVVNLNEHIRGLPGDRRLLLGASFFTMICFHTLQLRRMLSLDPFRPIGPVKQPFQIRDCFCPTILARSMLETYLHFFYLCCESVDEQTRELRLAIWDWHDCDDRLRGTESWSQSDAEMDEFRKARTSIGDRIKSLTLWQKLPLKYRKRTFEAGCAVIKPLRLIAESAGISSIYYDSVYTFFSTFAHAHPLAISHNLALGERTSEGKAMQWMSLSRQIDITIWICCFAMRDLLTLFPDARVKVHRRTQELTLLWSGIVRDWPRIE